MLPPHFLIKVIAASAVPPVAIKSSTKRIFSSIDTASS
jgi:hypothetical protein